jgi:SARP family transcriptional regulator, regulator of embCAB operon
VGTSQGGIGVGILGPLEVLGLDVDLKISPKERALLIALALRPDKVVGVSELIDILWDEDPPVTAHKTLQTYVSGLRRQLPSELLVTVPNGYKLAIESEAVDAYRFESILRAAEGKELKEADLVGACDLFNEGLALWRGRAMLDSRGLRALDAAAQRFEELRRGAVENRGRLWLLAGRHQEYVAEFDQAVSEEPFREQRWAQLMIALYRSGRQADALRTFQRLSAMLNDELGIDPSPELIKLDDDILRQSPDLDLLDIAPGRPQHAPVQAAKLVDLTRTLGVQDVGGPMKGMLRREDGTRVPLGAHGLRIGRSDESDLVLSDPKVSRNHASILLVESGFAIADHHSTNGTFVDGVRVLGSRELNHQNVITIGDSVFIFDNLTIDGDPES